MSKSFIYITIQEMSRHLKKTLNSIQNQSNSSFKIHICITSAVVEGCRKRRKKTLYSSSSLCMETPMSTSRQRIMPQCTCGLVVGRTAHEVRRKKWKTTEQLPSVHVNYHLLSKFMAPYSISD